MPPKCHPKVSLKSGNKMKGKKRKAKVVKAPRFTTEELNEEINTFLTSFNPYMSQNCVKFDLKSHTYKPMADFRKPVFCYRNYGATKQRLLGRYGVFYEEVPVTGEEKLKNRLNYRSVASQTKTCDSKDQNYIDSNLYSVVKFEGTASKETILKAYEENEGRKERQLQALKDSWIRTDLNKLVKKIGRRELAFQDGGRRYLKLCERMLDQNASEAVLDFAYYDNPNDEFTPGVGSLLPLWKICFKDVGRMPVTSLCWNALYRDLFAVGFRKKLDEDDEPDEDDLGQMRESGCVCLVSLKGPSHPEKILPCLRGVRGVAFHPQQPHLVAAGFAGGSLAVFDMQREANTPRGRDSKFSKFFHTEAVGELKWLQEKIPHKLCSVSPDGQIIKWCFYLSDLFPSDVVTSLRVREWPVDPPPKGLEMSLEPSQKLGENLGLNACTTALSVHPEDKELFLVGTETGLILRGSFDNKACNATYRENVGVISSVHWNPLHPRVFLSCSKDFTIQIWDHKEGHPVFEFFFENEVRDVAWAPFSSTLFAAISGNAIVSVFDLSLDREEAVGTFTCYTPKQEIGLTRLTFHPTMPVLLVGDDRGSVIVFKLSPNLRASMKALETMEKSKYVAGEIEKMEKLMTLSKVRSCPAT